MVTKTAFNTNNLNPIPVIKDILGLGEDTAKMYLLWRMLLGGAVGTAAGATVSYLKNSDPKIESLKRKNRFFSNKIEEMKNEAWMSEVMARKKKLDNAKLSPEERNQIEQEYIKLLNK